MGKPHEYPARVGPELCIASGQIVQPQPDSKNLPIDERVAPRAGEQVQAERHEVPSRDKEPHVERVAGTWLVDGIGSEVVSA